MAQAKKKTTSAMRQASGWCMGWDDQLAATVAILHHISYSFYTIRGDQFVPAKSDDPRMIPENMTILVTIVMSLFTSQPGSMNVRSVCGSVDVYDGCISGMLNMLNMFTHVFAQKRSSRCLRYWNPISRIWIHILEETISANFRLSVTKNISFG